MKSLFLTILLCASVVAQAQQSLTNQDVINLVKSGLSAEVVTAKVKQSGGAFDTSASALKQLKDEGVPESVILAMIETQSSNSGTKAPERPVRVTDELTTRFKQHQSSVVTVWSEFGHGTGFIVDHSGLVMTNQHVVGTSESIAIQFDEKRKIPAVLLAADAEKDVAVLWANLDALPEATVAPLAKADGAEPQVVEGERVFTIGSPLSQRKIMTSGIVSKIEPKAIISDININPGNSGGPLFNSLGQVVGLTTFLEGSAPGPGISGIVRLEEALPVLEQARTNTTDKSKPGSILLPVEPSGEFPLDAIKASLQTEKLDTRPYIFTAGNYDVALITPILKYHLSESGRIAASKEKEKRNKKQGAVQGTFRPLDNLRNWAEYAGQYKPVIMIKAAPQLRETFWSAFGRGMAANYGIQAQAKMRFKTDFYKMRLLCGGKEIQPIQPVKIPLVFDENNQFINVIDAAYAGFYTYPYDAISPSCGTVVLELYSEKNPEKATVKTLDKKSVTRVWTDFEPYARQVGENEQSNSGGNAPRTQTAPQSTNSPNAPNKPTP